MNKETQTRTMKQCSINADMRLDTEGHLFLAELPSEHEPGAAGGVTSSSPANTVPNSFCRGRDVLAPVRFMESIDIQQLNAHGDHEPVCSRRRESALIPAFDGARWRGLIPRCGTATEPRLMRRCCLDEGPMRFVIRSISIAFHALARTSHAATITLVHRTRGLLGCPALGAEQRP